MAGIRGTFCHWRQNGYRYQQDPNVVHVHVPADAGLSYRYIYDPGILDEYEAVYQSEEEKSSQVFIIIYCPFVLVVAA